MGLESGVNLVVAALDLKLVRMLRAAMAGGGAGPAVGPGLRPTSAAPTAAPVPRIEPRQVIHPTPRIEPRPVTHPTPAEAPQASPPVAPEQPRFIRSPFEPPWRVMPWETPPEPAPRLKVLVRKVDFTNRGRIFDVFC